MRKMFFVFCLIGILATSSCSMVPGSSTASTMSVSTKTATPIPTSTSTPTLRPTQTSTPTLEPTPTPYIYTPKMLADGILFSYIGLPYYGDKEGFGKYQKEQLNRLESLKGLTDLIYLKCDWNIVETMKKVDELGIKVSLGYTTSSDASAEINTFCWNTMENNQNVVEIRLDHNFDYEKYKDLKAIAKSRKIPTATIGYYDELDTPDWMKVNFNRRILSTNVEYGNESVDVRTNKTTFIIAKAQKKWPKIDIVIEGFDKRKKTSVETTVENYKNLWAITKKSGGRFIMSSYEDFFTPEMSKVFDGNLPEEIWSEKPVQGEGKPEIKIINNGSGKDNKMKGQVLHLKPSDYMIVLYIEVNGAWWVKPHFDEVVWPDENGYFETQVASGGLDSKRTQTIVLALPTYVTPQQSAGSEYPKMTYYSALAKVTIKNK